MKTSPARRLLPWVLVLGLVGTAAYGAGPGGWFRGDGESTLPGAPVRRGPLRVTVVQSGNLESKNSIKLQSKLEGQSTILYLIPEGTTVERGELVAELDTAELVDRQTNQDVVVQNAEAQFTKATQELEIQKSQNESDIAAAEQRVTFAQSDLRKFVEGDAPQERQEADESIMLSEEELVRAEERLNWSQELESNGFLRRTELEADELAFQRSKILLEQSKRRKQLLLEYDHPKTEAELRADLREAERELERVRLQARARLADYEVAKNTSEKRLRIEREKLARYEEQLANARIVAPEGGMIVYGREEGGRMRGDEPMSEGTTVRERQTIVEIPRPGGMVVKASVHESVIKRIQVGQSCEIKIDALPGQTFRGRVEHVALLPDKNSWWANPNQRLYATEIAILDSSTDMRPGMSCSIEILIDHVPDTLFVPLQAVTPHDGSTVCFVPSRSGFEVRKVEVGQSSDKWVQVLSGLEEGELVLMGPPSDFVPKTGRERIAPEDVEGDPGGPGGPGGVDGGFDGRPDGRDGAAFDGGERGARPAAGRGERGERTGRTREAGVIPGGGLEARRDGGSEGGGEGGRRSRGERSGGPGGDGPRAAEAEDGTASESGAPTGTGSGR